jgi:hypothetical protein
MLHGVMRQGSYDANVRTMVAGGRTYVVNGKETEVPEWPAAVDGIRFVALERRRRLLVVRLGFADQDIVLHHPVVLDPVRHLAGGGHPADPVAMLSDDLAERVLDDILAANPSQTNAIALVVNRVNQVRRAAREAAARGARPGGAPGRADGG